MLVQVVMEHTAADPVNHPAKPRPEATVPLPVRAWRRDTLSIKGVRTLDAVVGEVHRLRV